MTKDLLFVGKGDTLPCYVRKTITLTRRVDYFHSGSSSFASRVSGVLLIFLLGVSAGRAEPFSICQTNDDYAAAMTAWEGDSSRGGRTLSDWPSQIQDSRWRFAYLFKDKCESWDPWKKSFFNDPSSVEFVSVSGAPPISVPAVIADAALELQSIPIADDAPTGIPSWNRPPEEMETTQFAADASIGIVPAPGALSARESGESLEISAREAAQGPSKMEFSSADSASLHPDSPRDPGDLSDGLGSLPLSPPAPIPLIVSPEPNVTALWGISALLFACRRKMRSRR